MKDPAICTHCGREASLLYPVQDDAVCLACLEETVLCHVCGQRIWRDDNAGSDTIPLCRYCYDQHYAACSSCGELVRRHNACLLDDAEDAFLCRACFTRASQHRAIRDYYYKPEPVFYGTGPRYFGVELEIDGAGEDSEKARQLLDIANEHREHLYCKHDGSLEDGFELVTHPMSLDFHRLQMPWQPLLRKAADLGYRSHSAGTCGLHIHVSREAFGGSGTQQDAAIARVLYFFEKHWDALLKFSRRTQRQLDRWAARYGYKEHPMDILDHAKKYGHGGRYTSVNLQNDATIEFRIFRGTLRYHTLIAALQLVGRVCDAAAALSDEELKDLSWSAFVSGCTDPELAQYLKERRLCGTEADA